MQTLVLPQMSALGKLQGSPRELGIHDKSRFASVSITPSQASHKSRWRPTGKLGFEGENELSKLELCKGQARPTGNATKHEMLTFLGFARL